MDDTNQRLPQLFSGDLGLERDRVLVALRTTLNDPRFDDRSCVNSEGGPEWGLTTHELEEFERRVRKAYTGSKSIASSPVFHLALISAGLQAGLALRGPEPVYPAEDPVQTKRWQRARDMLSSWVSRDYREEVLARFDEIRQGKDVADDAAAEEWARTVLGDRDGSFAGETLNLARAFLASRAKVGT